MIRHKLPLSLDHLQAAVLFATQAREFEKGTISAVMFHPHEEHRAASIASVLSTVAYLEAAINEFFSNAAEQGAADGLAAAPLALQRLRAAWNLDVPRRSILEKYNYALALCDQPIFAKGAAPFQAAWLLVQFRNALTHFVPELQPGGGWPGEAAELTKLSKSLKLAFDENRLVAKHQPYFPYRCLGYSASKWAIASSIAYVKEFRARLGTGFSPTYILPFVAKL